MENVDIYALIDELQEEVELSKNCTFSKNKSVDPVVIAEIIEDMRKALDETLKYAKEIQAERDRVIQDANAEAEAIIKEAQKKAQEIISESAITKGAYEQSQKILDKTRQKTTEMKRVALDYAQDIFTDLESYYSESMNLLKDNMSRLQSKKDK